MAAEMDLVRTILEHPSDVEPRLALARRLEEHGDLCGELMRIQEQLRQTDLHDRADLEVRMHALLRAGVGPVVIGVSNSIGTRLALLFPGEFLMGSSDSDREAMVDEKPRHRVTIRKPFLLGVHLVSQREYEQVTGENPSEFKDPDRPVERVSWFDAATFCNRLSEKENLPTFYRIVREKVEILGGKGYRLPTEAEWEYACRAGTTTKYFFGDDIRLLREYAVFLPSRLAALLPRSTQRCGSRLPNPWGLYDMCGNVWEWCQDWYARYPSQDAVVDPSGPAEGFERVMRGGSFFELSCYVRSACRLFSEPEVPMGGFRLARTWEEGETGNAGGVPFTSGIRSE